MDLCHGAFAGMPLAALVYVWLDEMFERLILPFRAARSIHVDADLADATNEPASRKHTYDFADVDIVVFEGIFLFKRCYRRNFDLRLWVDCSFATALERALRRGQEGLPPEAASRDYDTIYFPAQRLRFDRDDPRSAADLIIHNDTRSAIDPTI